MIPVATNRKALLLLGTNASGFCSEPRLLSVAIIERHFIIIVKHIATERGLKLIVFVRQRWLADKSGVYPSERVTQAGKSHYQTKCCHKLRVLFSLSMET